MPPHLEEIIVDARQNNVHKAPKNLLLTRKIAVSGLLFGRAVAMSRRSRSQIQATHQQRRTCSRRRLIFCLSFQSIKSIFYLFPPRKFRDQSRCHLLGARLMPTMTLSFFRALRDSDSRRYINSFRRYKHHHDTFSFRQHCMRSKPRICVGICGAPDQPCADFAK